MKSGTETTKTRGPQPAIESKSPPKLSLLDATCIMVGIIIGASIYESSDEIAEGASHGTLALVQSLRGGEAAPPLSAGVQNTLATIGIIGVWLAGGLVALVGSLCYAELSTTFPREGGNYSFLKEAYGGNLAFGFAWLEFWIIRPGNVGAVAFVFANYAAKLLSAWQPGFQSSAGQVGLVCAAVIVLTGVNVIGVRAGTVTQNILTGCKVLGLLIIVATALWVMGGPPPEIPLQSRPFQPDLGLALIFVMFAYGGWSDMSYVAADVRDPKRNISRSLVLGSVSVTFIYLAVTLAFLGALTLAGLRNSSAVAADTLALGFGTRGQVAISLLICVSTLGAINGMLFAGARVFYGLGKEERTFGWLGNWNDRFGGPVRSLLIQSAATLGLAIAFGRSPNGFERLVVFTGPFFWGFLLLIAFGFFLLRLRGRIGGDGYKVPLYPLPPLILCLACALMTWKATQYSLMKWEEEAFRAGGYWSLAVILAGVGVMLVRPLILSRQSPS